MIETIQKKIGLSAKLTKASENYQIASRLMVKKMPFFPSREKYNLTISHEHKFLWFRVAKVATRTIFTIFKEAEVNLDAENAMFCHYPYTTYKNYYKFALIRNPFDRLVSCWRNKVIDNNGFKFSPNELKKMQDFKNFVGYVEKLNIDKCEHHLRSQTKLIDINNLDFLGRFERLDQDIPAILRAINIDDQLMAHKNPSEHKMHYRSYYDKDLQKRVAKIYERDLNIFNYDF